MTLLKTKGSTTGSPAVKNAGILSKAALSKLNTQAPELSKYVVAFKDLSDELPDSKGIQIGMVILDIKGKYVYVPIMAKAGDIQLIESMFDADSKTFIPLTRKSIEWMLNKGYRMGDSERIPSSVARDPDLYDAIVPPKTGKFVYASEGRLGGFLASMPNHIKQATSRILDEDYDLQEAMAPLMDIDVIRDHLVLSVGEEPEDEMGPPAPQVITSAKGLTEEQIQDIMAKGYTVKNPPNSKRIAVESSEASYGALTRLSALRAGTAVQAMRKDGSWTSIAALRTVPRATYDSESDYTRNNRSSSVGQDPEVVAITDRGEYLTDPNIVISSAECSYAEVLEQFSPKRITEVSIGDEGVIFTGAAFIEPLKVTNVTKVNGWTTVEAGGHRIMTHPSIRIMCEVRGKDIIVSDSAMLYPAKPGFDIMETDIGTAQYKSDIEMTKMLPYQSTLIHRDGVYAVDGKEIGGKPQIVEHLLKTWEIDVPSVETFLQKSEAQPSVIVKMAAVRDGGRPSSARGTKVQPHYQQGAQPVSDEQMTGTALQRARGMASAGRQVSDVKDREVMEATLISEMLQNPDLAGSIKEYLPEIRQAVDKLGRTLFLMRINTHKLNESVDAEALNNLFTATRNAYRILGENCVTLENLAANELG